MHQPLLPLATFDSGSIEERFWRFDREHPEVYALFVKLAKKLRRAGHERGSAEQIMQAIRWEHMLRPGTRESGFKLNDHFRSHYARKLAAEQPREFGSFFEFRRRSSRRGVD